MSTRPQKTGVGEGGNKKHRQTPYNKNAKGKAGGSGGHAGNANPGGVPGVSKIKSQIRQTTRLLNKENLEPALRVQTERRLTSLQADLAKAEHRTVERKNGERYHMVKFFERKKILRIIKRIQRQLKELEATDAGKGKEKVQGDSVEVTREELEKDLEDARVMLNYVIHYPNTLKYVSLFPATSANGKSKADDETEDQQGKLVLPPLLSQAAIDAISAATSQQSTNKKQKQKSGNAMVDKRRLDMLLKIRDLMRDLAAGKVTGDVAVSLQPENEKEDDRRKKISFDDVLGIKTTPADVAATSADASKTVVEKQEKEEDDFFE